jgi:hypothetical protein
VNRKAAVQYLHERHPDVIDAPGEMVDLEALHLEACWFQGHTCELMDARAEADLRRCFATIHHVLVRGDREVQDALYEHYVIPDLVFHPALAWAKRQMPSLLAELLEKARQAIDEEFARGPTGMTGE